MTRLFRWLWFGDGHAHTWEQFDSHALTGSGGKGAYGFVYDLRCKSCGKITFTKFVNYQ